MSVVGDSLGRPRNRRSRSFREHFANTILSGNQSKCYESEFAKLANSSRTVVPYANFTYLIIFFVFFSF